MHKYCKKEKKERGIKMPGEYIKVYFYRGVYLVTDN